MPIDVMNVGFGNLVNTGRVVAVTGAGSAPVKRTINSAMKEGRIVDATNGRRTRAVIVTDSNHVILSHLNPQTIGERLSGARRVVLDTDEDAETDAS